jgi:hypothetical protein
MSKIRYDLAMDAMSGLRRYIDESPETIDTIQLLHDIEHKISELLDIEIVLNSKGTNQVTLRKGKKKNGDLRTEPTNLGEMPETVGNTTG